MKGLSSLTKASSQGNSGQRVILEFPEQTKPGSLSLNLKNIDQLSEQLIVDFVHQSGCKTYDEAYVAVEFLMKKAARAIEKNNGPAEASAACERIAMMLINDPQIPSN